MRNLLFVAVASLLIVACGDDGNAAETQVEPTITPTSAFVSNFAGPMLNSVDQAPASEIEDCSLDPNATGCSVSALAGDVEIAGPLPLTSAEWRDVRYGIPQGFDAIVSDDEIIIDAIDYDVTPGSPVFRLRAVPTDTVETILASYATLNDNQLMYRDNGLGEGYTIPKAGYGMIGIWPHTANTSLIIEATVLPGFWPAYSATYMALIDSIEAVGSSS